MIHRHAHTTNLHYQDTADESEKKMKRIEKKVQNMEYDFLMVQCLKMPKYYTNSPEKIEIFEKKNG